jgi:hypothetical protein
MPPESWATLVFVGVLFLAAHVTVTPRGDEREPEARDETPLRPADVTS